MDWIAQAKIRIAEREAATVKKEAYVFGRKVLRRVRRIDRAVSTHEYEATVYVEYADGSMDVQTQTLHDSSTRVRLRDNLSKWEYTLPGCHGWFRCDPQYQLQLVA